MLTQLRARFLRVGANHWAVLRNSFYNLVGLGVPAIIAIFAIPQLIHGLGSDKFGILTIIWAVVSYFGLFDLGLGRALTQHIASALERENTADVYKVVGTGSAVMILLGIGGGLLMAALTPILSRQLALTEYVNEVSTAFLWMALAIPAIVMTSCYRGILEAAERFALINFIRLPMGVFTFVAPLVVLAHVGPRLDVIALVLAIGRLFACIVHGICAVSILPGRRGHGRFDSKFAPTLIRTGGWLTVSNVVSPLMNYIDRFILGVVASGAAVAYYATPQELLLRIGIIPTALSTVLFPIFARNFASSDFLRGKAQLKSYTIFIVMVMLPITSLLVVFADLILTVWIGAEFADNASLILKVMAVAALFSGVAQIPYTMLQGMARADLTGKLHLIEFPLYLALLGILAYYFGPVGAAIAWLVRIVADAAVLYYLNLLMLGSSGFSRFSNGHGNAGAQPTGATEP
jgi:O-antigen/teichoic acid export membrane protein